MDSNAIQLLLVEDNPGDARLIQEMLREARGVSFSAEHVASLAAALERLAAGGIDVMLLDLGLPDAQGLETLIKAHECAPNVPILILTGLDDEELAIQAVQEGAQDYLVKGQINSSPFTRAIRYAIERTQAEEALRASQDLLRTVIANAPVVLFSTDPEGTVALCEGKGLIALQLRPDQIVGAALSTLERTVPLMAQAIRQALRGRTLTNTLKINQLAFEAHYAPIRDRNGNVCGATGVATDVTERERAEAELRATVAELERRNQELNSFTYSVSHDLKEPLRTLEAFSQFLLEDYSQRLDEQGRDYLARIGNAGARLKRMIEELLVLSRMARPPEDLSRVDVAQVVANVSAAFQAMTEQRGARVEVDGPLPPALGDVTRIEQVFGNLISNGVKFNHSEPPVVTVSVRDVSSDNVTFSIRDNGIGIDPQYHEQIFGVFQRLHRREDYDGTGAGLAIVQRAAEALGGRVWLESAPGSGTTFYVTLPAWAETPAAVAVA